MELKGLRECLLDDKILLQKCRQRNLRAFTNLKRKMIPRIYLLYFPSEPLVNFILAFLNWTSTQKGLFLVGGRVEDVDRFCEVATGGGM